MEFINSQEPEHYQTMVDAVKCGNEAEDSK